MKIAFVRGPHLNPWETQTYLQVASRHSFIALGADWSFYKKDFTLPNIEQRRVHVWGSQLSCISPNLPMYYNRALSWTTGRSFGLSGLAAFVHGADILHSAETYFTMSYQCAQIKKHTGQRLALTVWENIAGQGEMHPLRCRRKQEVLNLVDGIIAVTKTTRALLLREGVPVSKIAVIPMAIDTDQFSPGPRSPELSQRLGIHSHDVVILFIGRLVEEKGVLDLLKAIPRVVSACRQSPVRFLFIGAGPLEAEVRSAQASSKGAVLLWEFQPYHQLPELHKMADIFVLPSKPVRQWAEQFGYVLIESMATGKAILTTQSGSIPDVVSDGGRLIAPASPEALTEALIELVQKADLRDEMGKKARRRAMETFSFEAVTPQLMRFYEQTQKGLPVNPE